ncbi:MAG: 3'(2'),5'-bisphosphate nucleotidase CysQ [Caulobacterales bacterium]
MQGDSPVPLTPPLNQDAVRDRALLAEAAREAGALALKMKKAGVKKLKKDDGSPVSNADIAVNDLLESALRKARPDYAWLSEESADSTDRFEAARIFIVDPIDGTADFLAGKPRWCIALAVLEAQAVIASAIYNPMTDELFEAALGHGALCNGARLEVSGATELEHCRIMSNPAFERPEWPVSWPRMRVKPGGSCGQRMADVASGRADAYLAMAAKWDWDTAPGALLVTEAGGVATDTQGAPFAYNLSVPRQRSVAAATPALHPLILKRTGLIRLPVEVKPSGKLATEGQH